MQMLIRTLSVSYIDNLHSVSYIDNLYSVCTSSVPIYSHTTIPHLHMHS